MRAWRSGVTISTNKPPKPLTQARRPEGWTAATNSAAVCVRLWALSKGRQLRQAIVLVHGARTHTHTL